jgi:hypothetical protein
MKLLLLVFILAFFISCQKDNQLIPDTGRKLVINGLITTDERFGVNITQSMYITDTSKWLGTDIVTNLQASIYENSVYVDSLQYNGYHSDYMNMFQMPVNFETLKYRPSACKEYKILVKASGYSDAYATTKIPNLVKIERIDTSRIILEGPLDWWESKVWLQCNIEFTDPAGTKNFYLLYIYNTTNNQATSPMAFTCNDPVVEEHLEHGTIPFGIAFSDKSINGKRYKLPIILKGNDIGGPFQDNGSGNPFPQANKTSIYFRLYSITEEYFKYIQTLNLFLKNYTDPLAEPTQVYSNINGGYGIFAGAAVSSDSIIFHQ